MLRDVFLISVDCLRPDFLGAYDPKRRQSPVIDTLAQHAAVFTEAVSHAPFTTPAIASLLTGVYPFRTGVRLLLGQLCNEKTPTLADYARRAGFLTAGFPSTFILNSPTGLARGFEVYRDIHDGTMTCRGGCWQTGDRLNEAVDRLLTSAGPRPVFCWLHYFDLHEYHLDRTVPVDISYPRDLTYKIDRDCIGGLLEILRRHNRLDEAAFILTADHAESLNAHGERGHGQNLYDSVLRVPLIWRWGSLTQSTGRIDRQVRHVDILPTLLELWGFPREEWPPVLDGQSLVPLLRGAMGGTEHRRFTSGPSYAEASPRQLFEGDIKANKPFAGPEQRALRTHRHKFILHRDGDRELYDLRADPQEQFNVATAHPARANEFFRKLSVLSAGDASDFAQASFSKQEEEKLMSRLRVLGYVS